MRTLTKSPRTAALAGAEGRAVEAGAASAAATRTALGGTAVGLGLLATVAGVAFGAFKQFQSQIRDDGTLTSYRDNLGLTYQEMLKLSDGVEEVNGHIKQLGDVTVTYGDVMHGVWAEIAREVNAGGAWESAKRSATSAFSVILSAWT